MASKPLERTAPRRPRGFHGSRAAAVGLPVEAPRAAQRARRLRQLLLAALLAATAILGLMVLMSSPLLAVRDIEVVGTRHLDPDAVRQLSGALNENILLLQTGAVERRLESQVLVADARVERTWPTGLRITITERAPWGYWEVGGRRSVIAADGVVLEGLGLRPPTGAPVIVASGTGGVAIGGSVDEDAARLVERLRRDLPERLGLGAAAFEYSPGRGLTVVTTDGLRVIFGGGEDYAYKLAVLQELLPELRERGLTAAEIDLRFGARPAVRLPWSTP